jgi:hypothetical protein
MRDMQTILWFLFIFVVLVPIIGTITVYFGVVLLNFLFNIFFGKDLF